MNLIEANTFLNEKCLLTTCSRRCSYSLKQLSHLARRLHLMEIHRMSSASQPSIKHTVRYTVLSN